MPAADPNPYLSPPAPRESDSASSIDVDRPARGNALWLAYCGGWWGATQGAMFGLLGGAAGMTAKFGLMIVLLAKPGESFPYSLEGFFWTGVTLTIACSFLMATLLGVAGIAGGFSVTGFEQAQQSRLQRLAAIGPALGLAIVCWGLLAYQASVRLLDPTLDPNAPDQFAAWETWLSNWLACISICIAAYFAGWRWANLMIAEAWPETSGADDRANGGAIQ